MMSGCVCVCVFTSAYSTLLKILDFFLESLHYLHEVIHCFLTIPVECQYKNQSPLLSDKNFPHTLMILYHTILIATIWEGTSILIYKPKQRERLIYLNLVSSTRSCSLNPDISISKLVLCSLIHYTVSLIMIQHLRPCIIISLNPSSCLL